MRVGGGGGRGGVAEYGTRKSTAASRASWHFFFTDVLGVAITFFLLSSISHSITSVIGSITCGVLINITLMLNRAVGEVDEQDIINAK